jgi:biopolymer transport protein ExbB/TolQ
MFRMPTWADFFAVVVAIVSGLVSGAVSFGALNEKIKGLEEKAFRGEQLEEDFRDIVQRMARLEEGIKHTNEMLTEMRSYWLNQPNVRIPARSV